MILNLSYNVSFDKETIRITAEQGGGIEYDDKFTVKGNEAHIAAVIASLIDSYYIDVDDIYYCGYLSTENREMDEELLEVYFHKIFKYLK